MAEQYENPWTWKAADVAGLWLTVTISWNSSTRALTGVTVARDPGCTIGHFYMGLGTDGRPEGTKGNLAIPAGATSASFNATALRKYGLNTIDDVAALQMTAGP